MSLSAAQQHLVDACLAQRVMMRQRADDGTLTGALISPPVTMQPSKVTRRSLARLARLQLIWSDLVDVASRDLHFLETILGLSDEFALKLLATAKEVYGSPQLAQSEWPQTLMLGIYRSDYMRTPVAATAAAIENEWRHVEINTISCSFAGLSSRVGHVHKAIAAPEHAPRVLVSESEVKVPSGLAVASLEWLRQDKGRRTTDPNPAAATSGSRFVPDPLVVFVVQEGERNFVDQRLLMESLKAQFNIDSRRMTLREIHESMTLVSVDGGVPGARGANALVDIAVAPNDDNATITCDEAPHRQRRFVSVFYFRSTYDIKDFDVGDFAWSLRANIERSSAIKCPSLPVQLFGMKRVQLALSRKSVLKQFLPDDELCDFMLSTVVGQFLITDPEAEPHIAAALRDRHAYVLKTQKEGFGKLYTDDDVTRLLSAKPGDHDYEYARSDLLLMERIRSRLVPGSIYRASHQYEYPDLALELGTFGVMVSDGTAVRPLADLKALLSKPDEDTYNVSVAPGSTVGATGRAPVYKNYHAGYLARTKSVSVEGGGVMSGIAALDALIDEQETS